MCFSNVFLGDQHSDIPASVSYWIHTIGNNSFKVHQVSAAWVKTLFIPSSCEMLGTKCEGCSIPDRCCGMAERSLATLRDWLYFTACGWV